MEENDGKLQWQIEPILFHFELRQLRSVMSPQQIHINGEPKLKGHSRDVLFEALFSHSNLKPILLSTYKNQMVNGNA